MFELLRHDGPEGRRAKWIPLAAAIAASASIAAWICPAPPLHSLTLPGLVALASRYILIVTLTGLAICMGARAILMRNGRLEVGPQNARILAAIMWLPPLTIFVSQKSIWSAVAAIVFSSLAARLLLRPGSVARSSPASVPTPSAIVVALCFQAGAVTALDGRPIASAAFLGISSAILAWSSNKFKHPAEPILQSRASASRTLLAAVLAIALTLGGLLRYVHFGGAGDMAGSGKSSTEGQSNLPERATGFRGGAYKGVILFPEPAPQAAFVAPRPRTKPALFTDNPSDPLSIPFYGVYWLFRPPDRQPRPDSFMARGTPVGLGFRANDLRTLSMEAHQNFGTLIDLNCCSRIELAITNADPYSGLITLELVFTNTRSPDRPSLSLGKANISSRLHWTFGSDHAPPVSEILRFGVPHLTRNHEFDEATIVFHRDGPTAFKSSRIAVDRFVLIPRG